MKIKIYKDTRLYRIDSFNLFKWKKEGIILKYKNIEYNLDRIVHEKGYNEAMYYLDNMEELELPKYVYKDIKEVKEYLLKKYIDSLNLSFVII